MPIRLSGLASGLDTEAIVGALVSAYSFKKDKYVKAQTKLSWKQDAWKSLNSKVYGLYTSVGSMRYSSSYTFKKTTVSDTTKAKATASGSAVNGTQLLRVKSLATTAYVTGGELAHDVKGDSTLFSMGIKTSEGTDENKVKASIQVRGSKGSQTIELEPTMTVNQFVSKLNDAGVQANFDEKNHRIFLSSNVSGKAGDFNVSGNNEMGINALISLGLLSDKEVASITSTATEGSEAVNISEMVARKFTYTMQDAEGNDFTTTVYGSKESFESSITNIRSAKLTLADSTATDADKAWANKILSNSDNQKIAAYIENKYKEADGTMDWHNLSKVTIKAEAEEMYAQNATDENRYDSAAANATKAEITYQVNRIRDAYVNIAKIKTDKYEDETLRQVDLSAAKSELSSILKDPTTAKWADYIQKNFGTVNSGTNDDYSDFWTQSDNLELANNVYYRVDLAAQISINGKTFTVPEGKAAKKVDGTDAEIELNGVSYFSETNSITVNGLTIEALAVTKDPISVSVQNDTDALYDKIKDFLSSYNSLMNEMQKLYNADSAKDYEPLTEDEKAEMSESEIEKWEQKIKDSLLRRDTSLSSIISTMTMSMMQTYEINGKNYSWSTFGIHTLGTLNAEKNEGYAYHIDGDSEDSYTSGKQDKLRSALAEDPETVIEFMKQLTSGLYSQMDAKMKSTAVKSVYTVYNDKEMASEYSDYSKLISQWTKRVTDMEDSYYKKFAAMEKALATLQGNSSSISSLLGS